MASSETQLINKIKPLLISALSKDNLTNYNIEIVGTSGKGDGYVGDIYFVNLLSPEKNYNFVLKCCKTDEIARKTFAIKTAFLNEIYMYRTIFPTFKQFEIQRNIRKVFNAPPQCYGIVANDGQETIILQNMKTVGYDLWPKELPLPRNFIENVLKQYGHWHAISAAMQIQQPIEFQRLVDNLRDFWAEFVPNFTSTYIGGMESITKLFENDMDDCILDEFRQFIKQCEYPLVNLRKKSKSFNVITHGDSWSNNFMFKTTGDNLEVTMLDWQISSFSSPVSDLAYFLYSSISREDLQDFDNLLMVYYRSFSEHLRNLGNNPMEIYKFSQLLDDWKIYARPMIIIALFIIYLLGDESKDLSDMTSTYNIKNAEIVKTRSRHIIEHIVKRGFIKPIKYPE